MWFCFPASVRPSHYSAVARRSLLLRGVLPLQVFLKGSNIMKHIIRSPLILLVVFISRFPGFLVTEGTQDTGLPVPWVWDGVIRYSDRRKHYAFLLMF